MTTLLNLMRTLFGPLISIIVTIIGKINWTQTKGISDMDKATIATLLKDNYYIILTRHSNHLSTYMINLSDYFLLGKMGYWSHGLLNIEGIVANNSDFQLLESTSLGVRIDSFDMIFGDCSAVTLLKPTKMTIDKWTATVETAKGDIGKAYDTLYDLAQSQKLSCVELVRHILKAEPTYATDFANLEALAQKNGEITPQMFYGCPDFEVVYEVRAS